MTIEDKFNEHRAEIAQSMQILGDWQEMIERLPDFIKELREMDLTEAEIKQEIYDEYNLTLEEIIEIKKQYFS